MAAEAYRVLMLDGKAMNATSLATGIRLRVMPGEHVVQWVTANRPGSTELEAALRFSGDTDRDALYVFKGEWPELHAWPSLLRPLVFLGAVA